MKHIYLLSRILIIFACILSIIAHQTFAQDVEELMDAQKEIRTMADVRAKENIDEEELIKQSKDAILMGQKEYERTCSLCHGLDGKGNGPYAFALTEKPTDLTLIQKKNYAEFPFSKLYRIIDGREELKSHGPRIMPVWGDRYNTEHWLEIRTRYSETLVRGRIFELLLYLESIQK